MRQKTQAVNGMSNSRKEASTSLADWQLDCVHFISDCRAHSPSRTRRR
jgi:hypothetical protein